MSENKTTANPLATMPVKKLIWKYSVPGIISQLINSVHNIVDQVFIGWGINDLGIAATNIVFPFSSIITALSALLGMGASAHFSILLGKKDPEKAADFIGTALTLMITTGILISVISSVFLKDILYLFGATDLIMPYALPYARIIVLGIPFAIFATGMSYFIRADGDPAYSSMTLLSGAVFNMVFDPVFLFIFNMGISGIALATVLGQVLSSLLALNYLFRKIKSITLTRSNFGIKSNITRSICSLGVATFTTHVLMTIVQIIQMNAFKTYGALSIYGSEVVIGASGAVGKVTMVCMSAIIGVAIGCQPILGFNLGSKRYDRVRETYLTAIKYGTAVAISAFLLLQLLPKPIISIFGSDDPLFYAFGTRYIRIYLLCIFLNALQPITSTFCTAIGKAKLGFWMAVIRQGMLMIPMLLFLPKLFGIDGALMAGCISDFCAAMVVIFIGSRQVKELKRLEKAANDLSS